MNEGSLVAYIHTLTHTSPFQIFLPLPALLSLGNCGSGMGESAPGVCGPAEMHSKQVGECTYVRVLSIAAFSYIPR